MPQDATRDNSQHAYDKFVESAWEGTKHCTLRGQLEFVTKGPKVSLDEVEPAANIVKRFVTGMSRSSDVRYFCPVHYFFLRLGSFMLFTARIFFVSVKEKRFFCDCEQGIYTRLFWVYSA